MMKIDEMPAGREIDALVAKKVMGAVACGAWRYLTYDRNVLEDGDCDHERCYPELCGSPHYSNNMEAAWSVIAAIVEDYDLWPCVELFSAGGKRIWNCYFWNGDDAMYSGDAITAPLAICRAALKIVDVPC